MKARIDEVEVLIDDSDAHLLSEYNWTILRNRNGYSRDLLSQSFASLNLAISGRCASEG